MSMVGSAAAPDINGGHSSRPQAGRVLEELPYLHALFFLVCGQKHCLKCFN
jgi:hypothetical protein